MPALPDDYKEFNIWEHLKMGSIAGTETEKNLLKSFAGESQARNRYTFFAKVASKEGYEHIARLFL